MRSNIIFLFILWVVVLLNVVNCQNPIQKKKKKMYTPVCLRPCPKEYKPICGVNDIIEYKTFRNKCEMDNSICTEGRVYAPYKTGTCY